MKKMILGIIGTLVLLVAVFVGVEYWAYRTPDIAIKDGSSEEQKLAQVHDWFDALEAADKFNGTILFARDGQALLHRNFGFASAAGDRAVTDRTSFNLASVAKHFTGFAILKLAYEGKLARDDMATKYIPEMVAYEGITINHLLYHTSGLPDYIAMSRKRMKPGDIFTADMLVSWFEKGDEPARFEPGEQEEYSNTGYVVLAEIIKRVSGQSYADHMRETIFEPLGMHDTYVVNQLTNTDVLHDRAYGFRRKYFHFGALIEYDLNHLDGAAGDGNIYASALDLVKWDRALREGTLLPREYYAQAYEPATLTNGEVTPVVRGQLFGMGWAVEEETGAVEAFGGWQGFNNHYRRDEASGTVMVILSNSGFIMRMASIGKKLLGVMGAR